MSVYKFSFYAAALLIAVGALLIFSDSTSSILGEVEQETNAKISAYAVARDTDTQYFNEDGSLSYTFKAAELKHYRPNDEEASSYSTAKKPIIEFVGQTNPWEIEAQKAHVSNERIITMSEDVIAQHTDLNNMHTVMHTQELIFEPEQKLAYTNKPVTIVSPLGKVSAVGMIADLQQRKITLKSKVKGLHSPEKINP
ncbi:LPS export ABC transporter periplasmic protein LptC [Agaribacterium sp. ZY112]|uniref:LPS export ABC transporter periplasmic protein LptC n=1 Tax=Agaribacterium sp. ZY112 TaxID=3233574 RepID=UPI003523B2D2